MLSLNKKVFIRFISLVTVALFVCSNIVYAVPISASDLSIKSTLKDGTFVQEIKGDLKTKGSSPIVKSAAQDGEIIPLKESTGLLEYLDRDGRELVGEALNNGTAHGNNYDKDGNLIETKMNLLLTAESFETVRPYGVKGIQHGITGTPIPNLPALRKVGIRIGHVGTNWQNIIWEILVEESKSDSKIADLVNRMTDWVINSFGEIEKKGKKVYDVSKTNIGKPHHQEFVKFQELRAIEKTKSRELSPDESRELAELKKLDILLGKELKNSLGPFRDAELEALPQYIKDKIDKATEKSATEHMLGFGSDGTATLVRDYLENSLYAPIQRSSLFKLGWEPQGAVEIDLTSEITAAIAVSLTQGGYRGKALGLDAKADKAKIQAIVDESDGFAKAGVQRVVDKRGVILVVHTSEGFGRDELADSLKAGDIVIPSALAGQTELIASAVKAGADYYTALEGQRYKIEHAIIDVIDGTKQFVTNVGGKELSAVKKNEAGGTSIVVTGPGVKSMPSCPDVYTDMIITVVPLQKYAEFIAKPLDPEVIAQDPNKIKEMLERIATANGLTLNDLEVLVMERNRETTRLEVLRGLQKDYPGLEIVTIVDGTPSHGLEATFGRKTGKHKVVMTVSGTPEAEFNRAVASIFGKKGALFSGRLYSKEVDNTVAGKNTATDLTNRYNFTPDEIAEIGKFFGPEATKEIIAGKKLLTQADVKGRVAGAMPLITHNGIFGKQGVELLGEGNAKVNVLRFGELDARPAEWFQEVIVDSEGNVLPTSEVVSTRLSDRIKPGDSLPGLYLHRALETTDRIIMAANTRSFLSFPGLIRAAKKLEAMIIFQEAKSELKYTFPGGYKPENAIEFAERAKAECRKEGFQDFILKGDHITVQAPEGFLSDMDAQTKINDLLREILTLKDNSQREKKFNEKLQDKEFMANPNIAAVMKAINEALTLVKTEVRGDLTEFALDASFLPMDINTKVSALLGGFLQENAGIEAEVGEIGGSKNSTTADALELPTGIRYREQAFEKRGAVYTKLVQYNPGVPIADVFRADIEAKLNEGVVKKHKDAKGKLYPIVIAAADLLKNGPDGVMALENIKRQLGGEGKIKVILDITNVGIEEIAEILANINSKNGNLTDLSISTFDYVIKGTPDQIAKQVEEKYQTLIYKVIGNADYVAQFSDASARVMVEPASEGEISSLAKTLRLTFESIVYEGKITKEQARQLDGLFSVDEKGIARVKSAKVEENIAKEAKRYKTMIESETRV